MDYLEYIDRIVIKVMDYTPRLLLGAAIIYFGFKLVTQGLAWLNGIMKRNGFDADLRPFLSSLFSVLLRILLVLTAAEVVGVETTSFIALLAAAGFAIGLALQGSLSNFSGGILILVFKPFKTGDMIRAQEYTGIVREIQIFNTIIVTLNNRRIVIPNSLLTNGVIENITGAGIIRVDMTIGVSYNADIDEVRRVIKEVIDTCPYVQVPEIKGKYKHDILVHAMNDSTVDFMVRVWGLGDHYWEIHYFMQEHLKKAFDKHGIEIPFPQRDIHIRS